MNAIDTLFGRILSPIDGYKTKIGSWIAAFLAVNQALPVVGTGLASTLGYVAIALVAYGLRDAIEKANLNQTLTPK